MAYSDTLRRFEKRREKIIALRAQGWSLQKIATKYGISRERVRQILRPTA